MKTIFKTLTEACATVLKGHAGDAALVSKEMTADEFAAHATSEIEKAKADTAEKAIARLSALRTSIAVAASAFVAKELDKFEIPIFDEAAQVDADMAKKVAGLEATVAELKLKLDKAAEGEGDGKPGEGEGEGEGDGKPGEGEGEGKGAEGEGDGKPGEGKGKGDETDADKAAKAKADAEKKAADKKAADEAAAAKKAADEAGDKGWPMDLAKSFGDDEVRELYDWGPDPKAAPTQH